MTLALRPVTEEDAPTLLRWRNQPEVARQMFTDHTIGPEEHAAWLARALARDDAIYWIVTRDGSDVGYACITDIDRRHDTCSWALYLGEPSARGDGVGGYITYAVMEHAFGALELRKASCEVLATNTPALTMYERFGFVREGVLREQVLKDSGPVDVYRMGLLHREWRELREGHRRRLEGRGLITA